MGCDIHCFVEKRNNKNNQWELFNEKIFTQWRDEKCSKPFSDRNYAVFATLAGVRNIYGMTPIVPSRGVPDDMSEQVKKELDLRRYDAHSGNWIYLKELLDFDFDNCISKNSKDTYRELISSEEFFTNLEELRTVGNPEDVRIVFWFYC